MLSVDDFSFKSYVRLGDYYECSRGGQTSQSLVKMSEGALDALTSSGSLELENSRQGTGNWSTSNQFETDPHLNLFEPMSQHNHSTNITSSLNYPNIEPPIAHTANIASTSRPSLFDPRSSCGLDICDPLNGNHNGDPIMGPPPPAAHTSNDCNTKYNFNLSLMDSFYPHQSLPSLPIPHSMSFPTPMQGSGAAVLDNPWSQLTRPICTLSSPAIMPGAFRGLESSVERDCMKNFFIQMAKEQLRLDKETQAQRQTALLEEREHFVAMQLKERIEHELKKPVDDLRLLNSKALPILSSIPGKRLSGKEFTDCLVVVEFLHAFTEILCIDAETIPTLGMLQTALVDRQPDCQQALLHLIIELLKFAILDPGLPSSRLVTQLLGQRFSELEVNSETVTGLLRVFLIGRNGFEDHMSDWLKPPCHLSEIPGAQQIALLAFVCDELVSSSRLISTEVDKTIELQIMLKREKWMLDSKIRRLRYIQSRKFDINNSTVANIPTESGPSKNFSNETSASQDVSMDLHSADDGHDDGSQSPGPSLDDHSDEKRKPVNSSKSHSKVVFGCDESGEAVDGVEKSFDCSAASNASAAAAAAVASTFLYSNEDEDVNDPNQLEARIESLTQLAEYKQMAIQECSYRLSGQFLGEDRFYRRYYNLGHLGGIFVEGGCSEKSHSDSSLINNDESQSDADNKFVEFDPDDLVSQIHAHHLLAERRRYVIQFPGPPHGNQNAQSNSSQSQTQTLNQNCLQIKLSSNDCQSQDDVSNDEIRRSVPASDVNVNIAEQCTVESKIIEPTSLLYNHADQSSKLQTSDNEKVTRSDQPLDDVPCKEDRNVPCEESLKSIEKISSQSDVLNTSTDEKFDDTCPVLIPPEYEVLSADNSNQKYEENDLSNVAPDLVPVLQSELKQPVEPTELLPNAAMEKLHPILNKHEQSSAMEVVDNENHSIKPDDLESDLMNGNYEKPDEVSNQVGALYNMSVDSLKCEPSDKKLPSNEQLSTSVSAMEKEDKNMNLASTQPLDLSMKCPDNNSLSTADTLRSKTYEGPELMKKLGLDDMVLTTATLLFMTQTSIIPASVACGATFPEPWRSVIAHYKSLLLCALSEELHSGEIVGEDCAVDGPIGDRVAPKTLFDAVSILKQTFLNEAGHSDKLANVDDGEIGKDDTNLAVSEDGLQILVDQELQARGVQQPTPLVPDTINPTEWFSINDPSTLQNLTHSLAPRGLRERSLAKCIKRTEQVLITSLKVAEHTVSQLTETGDGGTCEPRFLRVRSRRGKGRGSNAGGNNQPQSSHCNSTSNVLNTTSSSSDFYSAHPDDRDQTIEVELSRPDSPMDSSLDCNEPQIGLTQAVILEHRLRRRNTQPSLSTPSTSNQTEASNAIGRLDAAGRSDRKAGGRVSDSRLASRSLTDVVGSSDPIFLSECQFIEEVEALEDRVLNASLQVKGWQAPVKVVDDEMVHLIPRHTPKRSRFEYWPLDLARSRLLSLEMHLERRYLLPPLNCDFHLDVVSDPDQMSATDGGGGGRCLGEFVDAETGSESGFGCGPGSESTTTSLRDGECGGSSGHPQIRRVIGKHTSGHDLSNASTSPAITSCISNDNFDGSSHPFGMSEQIPPGLLEWRQKLQRASDLNTLRCSVDQLIDAIAWDKSIMKVVIVVSNKEHWIAVSSCLGVTSNVYFVCSLLELGVLCQICRRDNNEAQLLLCDGCDHGYHTYCFRPQLIDIPMGDWFCYDCVSKAMSKLLCFICGGTGVLHKSNTTSGSNEASQRLLSCEFCSRAVHPTCPKSPITRPPRKWACAKCTALNIPFGPRTSANGSNNEKISSTTIAAASKTPKKGDNSSISVSPSHNDPSKKTNSSTKPNSPNSSSAEQTCVQQNHAILMSNKQRALKTGFLNRLKQQRRNLNPLLKNKRKTELGRASKADSINRKRKRSAFLNLRHSDVKGTKKRSTLLSSKRITDFDKEYAFEVEDEIPQKSLTPGEVKWCRMVTKDLIKHEASWAFRKPVNVKKVPIYRQIIKHPMDLSTIYKKTRHPCVYSSIENWYEDICLIFDNCETFNEDDSDVGRAGHVMRAYFNSNWKHGMLQKTEPNSGLSVEECSQSDSPPDLCSAGMKQTLSSPITIPPSHPMPAKFPVSSKQEDEECYEVDAQPENFITPSNTPTNSPNERKTPIPNSEESSPSSHSSGFSGFEQNEYMMDVPLDALTPSAPSMIVTTTESNSTQVFSSHPPTNTIVSSLLPSECCLPVTSNSLKN